MPVTRLVATFLAAVWTAAAAVRSTMRCRHAFLSLALALALAGCVGDSPLHCAPGTSLASGTCGSLQFTCGAGTHLSGDLCVADNAVTCGPGTWTDGTVCRPIGSGVTCGAGTHLEGTTCVPDAGTTCGAGTHLEGTICVRDAGTTITCGTGTHAVGLVCMPDPSMSCGTGTHLDGQQCVADSVIACGPGTHSDGTRCVQDASVVFDLRIATTSIPADGYSKIPVLALGRNADGTPAQADMVLWVSRPGSGTFTPTLFTLGVMGTTSYFVPCSHANVGCTGPTEIRLSLASDPAAVVASISVNLVAPAGVGSPANCLVGGNVLFFDGSGWIFTGTQTVTLGTFSATASAEDVQLWIVPSDPQQGLWWDLDFSSRQLSLPLTTQVYDGAERAPFASPGHPGIDIGGDGRGCNTISGRFQIEELSWTGPTLTRFTATFEQFCEEMQTNVLHGCVHFEQ